MLVKNILLECLSLVSFLWDIGKQFKTRSGAAKCCVWSDSQLFAEVSFKFFIKMKNNTQQP